jgi:hypothetical protein
MVDEGLTHVAVSARQAVEPLGRFPCRRHMGEHCRFAVWTVVVAAFAAGLLTPVAAKAHVGAAPPGGQGVVCAGTSPHKLVACLSPQLSPRR